MCILSFLFILSIVILNAENQFEILYSGISEDNFKNEGWYIENPHRTYFFSKCGDQNLFGGFEIFSSNTIISYNSRLPPHFQIKISFKFWKIDSWNDEYVYIFLDDKLKKEVYSMIQDYQVCGIGGWDYGDKNETFEIQMNHSSKFIFIIITSNLEQDSTNESWGISEFEIKILQCPKGCIYCQDDINPCYYWIHFKSFWQTSSEFDEWKIDNNTKLNSSQFAGLNITGGYLKLGLNQTIENTIYNLSFHFSVQTEFKIWFFGNWTNDYFIFKLDDYQLLKEHINQSAHMINYGGIKQNVSFINYKVQMNHSQSSIKITFATMSNSTIKKYWGINAFDLYLGKCSTNCEQCFGPEQKECTVCIKDWVRFIGQCIYYDQIPPLTFMPIRIVQKLYQIQNNNIHLIQLTSDLIAQETLKLGENTSIINFEIIAQCPQNLNIHNTIQIYIRQNNQQEYILSSSCKKNFPKIIINANLQQKFEQIKLFIIELTETSVELYQVVIMDYQQTKLLLLRVNLTWI